MCLPFYTLCNTCECHCSVVSSAILSVLKTPPVVRKTPSLLREAAATPSVSKSILSAARHKNNAVSATPARLTWDSTSTSLFSVGSIVSTHCLKSTTLLFLELLSQKWTDFNNFWYSNTRAHTPVSRPFFQDYLGEPVPVWTLLKQETVSGSGISRAVCKSAPRCRQITMPAPHHSVSYKPDALPATQPTASKHWRNLK